MPVQNEERFIRQSLRAVLAQDYPSNRMEVLVVDGLSSDRTYEIILQVIAEYPRENVRVLENQGRIVPTGLNLAIRQARGEIIVRVDGHTIVATDYSCQCVLALHRTGADNVGGRMATVSTTMFGQAVAMATSSPFGVGGARFHYSDKEEWTDTAYMGAWPRRVFDKIGVFDEELVRDQDDEFNYRLRAAGGKILLSPKIRSKYTVRSKPGTLWRQYYQYGYWKVRVLQKHPRQMSLRQFVPPAFVLALLVSLIASFAAPWGMWLLGFVTGSYLLANAAASILTAVNKGWEYLPVLPLVFSILHLSYGTGFLVGLIKFANRWGDRRGKVPEWPDGQMNSRAKAGSP
jgi:cellulose synthase/poly-beta-1,6-N-acetylglucosamine synthase-like glycosyltransferase